MTNRYVAPKSHSRSRFSRIAVVAAFAAVTLGVAKQTSAHRSPGTCTQIGLNGPDTTIGYVTAPGATPIEHGDEICFQVQISNTCMNCCDVTLLDTELVLPDGSIVPITVDATVLSGGGFICPSADPRCTTASSCTIPGEVGYRYIVDHGDEHGATGTNCPPTPAPGTGEVSAYIGSTSGTVHMPIHVGASICKKSSTEIFHCVTSADCDDGIACTIDTCVTETCVNSVNDAFCDDQFGQSTTPPASLKSTATLDGSSSDSDPRVVFAGSGLWVAVWESQDDLGGTIGNDYDILFSRSTDLGMTWTPPQTLNTTAATDGPYSDDTDPSLATDGLGHWVAVWGYGEISGNTVIGDLDILVSRSDDNGNTWTPPVPIDANFATETFHDLFPRSYSDRNGTWIVAWFATETLPSYNKSDILVARSTDNGLNWTPPVLLNSNGGIGTPLDDYPDLGTDRAGNWVAVWRTGDSLGGTIGSEGDILVARSADNGINWTTAVPLNSNAATDSGTDHFPQVATDGFGNWVAIWSSTDSLGGTIGTDYDILVARSIDNGATWTPPVPLNSNAASDTGHDRYPQVLLTDGNGSWVASWSSTDMLGGTVGSDFDILVSRSKDNGATWTAPQPLNTNAATDVGTDVICRMDQDARGNWVALWYSNDGLGGSFGNDNDILFARFSIPLPPSANSTTKLYEFVGTANGLNGAWCLREPACFEVGNLNVPGTFSMEDLRSNFVASVNNLACCNKLQATPIGAVEGPDPTTGDFKARFEIKADTCGGTFELRVGQGGAVSCDALALVLTNVNVPAHYNPDVYEISLSGNNIPAIGGLGLIVLVLLLLCAGYIVITRRQVPTSE